MSMQASNAPEAIAFWHRTEKPSSRYIPFRQHGQLKDRHETETQKKKKGRVSSVGRAPDYRAECRGFDSRGPRNTQGLKKNWEMKVLHAFALQTARLTFEWQGWPRKMAAPSPTGGLKIVSPIITFVLNTLKLKWSGSFSILICRGKMESSLQTK